MKRGEFIKTLGMLGAGWTLVPGYVDATDWSSAEDNRMPVMFVGHGSPLNAIADNAYTQALTAVSGRIPRPKAILVISAHWLTRGSYVTGNAEPPTIHDFYGFPEELYALQYPAPGTPGAAKMTMEMLKKVNGMADMRRGLDHGAWSVLRHLYPKADIPVYELSIDRSSRLEEQYLIGRLVRDLRDKGILIIGSGNLTHNLGEMAEEVDAEVPLWAEEFDAKVANFLVRGDHKALTQYESWGKISRLAHPSNDHYLPLIYVTGMLHEGEAVEFFYEGFEYGCISMRGLIAGI
ncbi:MAG: 4,5-DOPA dioxygenase extradiol [Bacteroidota bacterium]